jgi:riboflavin synthase
MFTGIIMHRGEIRHIQKSGDWQFVIAVESFTGDLAMGASVACSGTCLTVTEKTKDSFTVQVSAETLARTTLGHWSEGTNINLERALKVGDELGGHFVSGHVDGLAEIVNKTASGDSWRLTLRAPAVLSKFIAQKGSVTLDGVSLTVNEVQGNDFTVNIIPHTLTHTTLGQRKTGDTLNLEIDLIARQRS